jgi:hypothetical protein
MLTCMSLGGSPRNSLLFGFGLAFCAVSLVAAAMACRKMGAGLSSPHSIDLDMYSMYSRQIEDIQMMMTFVFD